MEKYRVKPYFRYYFGEKLSSDYRFMVQKRFLLIFWIAVYSTRKLNDATEMKINLENKKNGI